jgi:hypothetical protein
MPWMSTDWWLMSIISCWKKEGVLGVGTWDTGLMNAPKTTTTRRRPRKCLKRRWMEGNSMLKYGPYSRGWQRKTGMSFWRMPKSRFLKRRTVSMSVSPYLNVYSVTIANISWNSIFVPINIGLSKQTVKTLIDSGAGGMFIDQNFAKNFEINYLNESVKAYNVDRTENKWGTINAHVNLKFKLGDQKFNERFYVTGLGKQRIILGFSWLHKYNPIIKKKLPLNPSQSTGDPYRTRQTNSTGTTT